MANAAPTPTTSPTTVRWSGVRPVRRNALPTGRIAFSIGLRKLPSNIGARLLLGFGRMSSMSKSTPADLAVAFRSLGRRRDEALEAAKGAPVGSLLAELDGRIAAAAAVVGSAPDPAAIADCNRLAAERTMGRRDARRAPPARHRRRRRPSPHRRVRPTADDVRSVSGRRLPRLGVRLDEVLDHGAVDRRRRARAHADGAGPRPSSRAPATSGGCAARATPAAPRHGRPGSRRPAGRRPRRRSR